MPEYTPPHSQAEKDQGLSLPQAALLAAAHDYLARGWPVIPLSGKLPTVAWKEFQSRLPSGEELRSWFTAKKAPTGIGVVTGRVSGLVVVDCDTRQDAEYWIEKHGSTPLVVATGGGGVHIYYAMPADQEIRNRARLLGRKLDLRGEGGYVAAPPSLHPTGNPYLWQTKDLESGLPRFEPAWLTLEQQTPGMPHNSSTVKVRRAVAYIRRIHARAGEGGHNATFRAACKLRDAGFSPEEALAVLTDWNETNATPRWSAAELIHKIKSAYQ